MGIQFVAFKGMADRHIPRRLQNRKLKNMVLGLKAWGLKLRGELGCGRCIILYITNRNNGESNGKESGNEMETGL